MRLTKEQLQDRRNDPNWTDVPDQQDFIDTIDALEKELVEAKAQLVKAPLSTPDQVKVEYVTIEEASRRLFNQQASLTSLYKQLDEAKAQTAAMLEKAALECERHAEFCHNEAHNGGDFEHLITREAEARYNAERIRALITADQSAALADRIGNTTREQSLCFAAEIGWWHQNWHRDTGIPCDGTMEVCKRAETCRTSEMPALADRIKEARREEAKLWSEHTESSAWKRYRLSALQPAEEDTK